MTQNADTEGRYQWAVQAPDGRVFSRVDHEDALKYLPDGWSVVRRPIDVGWERVRVYGPDGEPFDEVLVTKSGRVLTDATIDLFAEIDAPPIGRLES